RVTDILKAANIDEEVLKTLSQEDLKDLFPGPENFLKRKKLWDMIGPKDGDPDQDRGSGNVSATCAVLTSQPQTSTPVHEITAKTVKLPDPPEYVVYTDSELDMAMDELRRILGGTNPKYIDETKKKWENFCANVQFYGVWKKVLKPPIPLNMHDADFTIAILTGLPSLFPSPTSPPKRLGNPSEALLHVLQAREDPSLYLEKRPLTSPVLLFDGKVCILAVGNVLVSTIPKEEFFDGMLILMAYYYTMHLTYPKCVGHIPKMCLSVIQTEVLCDAIHDRDATGACKRAMAEWKSFTEK
ncbi:hypothetical protein NFI96_019151, partial [Prochilodus magdalenae]